MAKHWQPRRRTYKQVCLAGIAILALAGLSFSQSASDWPQLHNTNMQRWNPNESVLNVSNVGRLKLRWRYRTGQEVASSPAVANGVVYIGSFDGNLYALNSSTGAKLWSYMRGKESDYGQVDSSPAFANGIVYIGSGDHNVYAVDSGTGALKWSYKTGDRVDAPVTVAGGVVYVGSLDGNLYALNAGTGALLWKYQLGAMGCAELWSSPAVVDGVVYVGTSCGGSVIALNSTAGTLLWSFQPGTAEDSSPAVSDGVVYAGFGWGDLYAVNASTEAELWTQSTATGLPLYTSAAVANGIVHVGSYDGNIDAFDTGTGSRLWTYATSGVWSSPAVANGVVYIGSFDGNLYAFNAATGAKLWNYNTGNAVKSSPVVVNGMVYVGASDGYVYAFGLPAASLSLSAIPYPTPPVTGGSLTYAFKVWNQSSVAALHEVLTAQVPEGTTFSSIALSGTAGLGSCTTPATGASGTVVCKENSVMRPCSTWTIRITVQISATVGTVIAETATASSDNLGSSTATAKNTVH